MLIFFENSKAISPVVATALLLVVAVVSVVGFQGWFSEFSSKVLVDVEKDSTSSFNSVKVEGIINDVLYLNSQGNSDLSLLSVMDSSGVEVCSFSSLGNLSDVGIVGHWKFDDNAGIIKDYSGNGNDGKLFGNSRLLLNFDSGNADDLTSYNNSGVVSGAFWNSSCSVSGGCFEFDGVNDFISIDNNGSLNIGVNDMSLSYWVKSNSNTYSKFLSKKNMDNNNVGWGVYVSSSSPQRHVYKLSDGTSSIQDTFIETGMHDGVWHHLVLTFDRDVGCSSYFDGVFQKLNTACKNLSGINLDNSNDFLIGNSAFSFNGSIDEVGIYSKALSSNEVKDLYNSKKAKFIEFTGSGLEFDGVDDYVEVLDSNSLDLTNEGTIITYSKMTRPIGTGAKFIYYKGKYNYGASYNSFFANSNIGSNFWIATTTKKTVSSWLNYEPSINKKYFVSTRFNVSEEMLLDINMNNYVGNNLTAPVITNNDSLIIGNYGFEDGNNYNFPGEIYEMMIFDRKINNFELENIYFNSISYFNTGINKIDLSSCNLDKGNKYGVVGFSGNNKIDVEVIAK